MLPTQIKRFLEKVKKVHPIYVALFLFFFSFLLMLSLTYNFPFFWEDSIYITSPEAAQNDKTSDTIPKIFSLFSDVFLDPRPFYTICYNGSGCRPMLYEFLYKAQATLFGLDVLSYHIERSLIFALCISLSFLFFHKHANHLAFGFLIPLFGVIPVLFKGESWVMVLYNADPMPHVILLTTLVLFLFYSFYDNEKVQNKFILSILCVLIILLTQISILLSHVGRIYFVIIFLFLFFTEKRKIVQPRYAALLAALFFLSIPVLGLLDSLFGVDIFQYRETLSTPLPGPVQESLSSLLFSHNILKFLINLPHSFLQHNIFLFFLFIIFFCMHIFSIITKREEQDKSELLSIRSLVILTFLWYFFTALLLFLSRGFILPKLYFLRFQFSLFILPQRLFVLSYCFYVYKKYFPNKKWGYYLMIFLVILGIGSNLYLLNQWRGGWGAYLLGYDTVRQYVDDHTEHALLVLPFDHASPLYFIPPSTNNHVMIVDLTNTSLLSSYGQNYSAVYIASRDPLIFDSNNVVNIANLTIVDRSPYGQVKEMLRRGYTTPMYVYKLQKSD